MPVQLTNRSRTLMILELNSGETVHLAPGETVDVPDFEVGGNPLVQKLRDRAALAVGEATPAEGAPTGSAAKPSTTGEPA